MTAKLHPNTEAILGKLTDEQKEELIKPGSALSYEEVQKRLQTAFDTAVSAPEKAVIEGWVARDKDVSHGCDLHLFTKVKPERRELMSDWVGGLSRIVLDSSLFPSITWESEPQRVRIEITLIDEKGG